MFRSVDGYSLECSQFDRNLFTLGSNAASIHRGDFIGGYMGPWSIIFVPDTQHMQHAIPITFLVFRLCWKKKDIIEIVGIDLTKKVDIIIYMYLYSIRFSESL